ncbi:hypothetical protein WJU16_25460 [Chitinophaga pollutisoli]|uniref:Uncharacterized protein n=1 Tax=Chitinophaga pollutisoli TaxID=3133966 RepID=A0ABZ2YNI9_9BACT
MKLFTSLILIVLLALQSVYPVVLYAGYYANKDYIAGMLCENRGRPALHCEGKCFLKKQIRKAGEEEQKEHASAKILEVCVYVQPATSHQQHDYAVPRAMEHPAFRPGHYAYNYYYSCFHPPCM